MGRGECETPNPKHQITNKLHAPNANGVKPFEGFALGFSALGICLRFGAWDFGFHPPPPRPRDAWKPGHHLLAVEMEDNCAL